MPRPPTPREPFDGSAQFTTHEAFHTHPPAFYCQPLPRPPVNAPLLTIAALPRTIVLARHRATRNERGRATRTALAGRLHTLKAAAFSKSTHIPSDSSLPPPPPSPPPQPAKKKTAASGPSYESQAKGAIIAIADRTGSSLQAIKVRSQKKRV